MANIFEYVGGQWVAEKDPDAVLDYTLDFSDVLPVGDVLLSASVVGYGVTVDTSGIVLDTSVTFWLSGGRRGTRASVTVHYVSVGGRKDDRTVYFDVRET